MDYDKLIEQLNAWNEQHLSVVCGGKHFACDYLCENEDCIVVRAATALYTLQTENERLHDLWSDASIRLEDELAENEKLRAELEQVKRERDAAIEYLREIEWCAGCKHFGGLDGCKKWAMGQCTEKHDLYEFIGPQKED